MPGQGPNQQGKRPKHGGCDHAQQDITEFLVEIKRAPHPGNQDRHQEHGNHCQQQPGRAKGQRFGQSQMQPAHGQNGNHRRPDGLRRSRWLYLRFGMGLSHLGVEPAYSFTPHRSGAPGGYNSCAMNMNKTTVRVYIFCALPGPACEPADDRRFCYSRLAGKADAGGHQPG